MLHQDDRAFLSDFSRISGQQPRGCWTQGNRIFKLDVQEQELVSLPESVGLLQGLEILSVAGNHMTSLPRSFGRLQRLEWLDLGGNSIRDFPRSLDSLEMLDELYIYDNSLSNIPGGMLERLSVLCLNGNGLRDVPECLAGMKRLRGLGLRRNRLTVFPAGLGLPQSLEWLDLGSNRLCSVPADLGKLINLNWLNLRENELIELPPSVWRLGAILGHVFVDPCVEKLTGEQTMHILLSGIPSYPPGVLSRAERGVWRLVEETPRLVGQVWSWLGSLPGAKRGSTNVRAFEEWFAAKCTVEAPGGETIVL